MTSLTRLERSLTRDLLCFGSVLAKIRPPMLVTGRAKDLLLLCFRELLEFSAGKATGGKLFFRENANIFTDSLSSLFDITGDHDHTNTGLLTLLDGFGDLIVVGKIDSWL